jgi:hypothetical protein
MTVGSRFNQFLATLVLTDDQRSDGSTKHSGVRGCLDEHYYGSYYAGNGFLVGSWGKSTEIRPPRDIDIMFALPKNVYDRFDGRPGNKQSQLLQEVKAVLQRTYQSTEMRGDGQVVVVPFSSYAVEVAPAFLLQSGQYYICDTNGGGRYKTTDPNAEIQKVKTSNDATNGNSRDLIRMMKRWQEYCNVDLRSFLIELLAIEFLVSWQHQGKSSVYYDWMVRDFFYFLKNKSQWSSVIVPGTYETITLGDTGWQSRAETAYDRALKACGHEKDNMPYSAGAEWQKIFGTDIPSG